MARRKKGAATSTSAEQAAADGPGLLDQDDLKVALMRRRTEKAQWRPVYRYLTRLVLMHPIALTVLLLMFVLTTLMDVFTYSLFLPFLAALSPDSGASLADETPLAFLVPYFEGSTIESRIRVIAGLFVATTVVSQLAVYAMSRVAEYIHLMVGRRIRFQVFEEIVETELRFMNRQRSADVYTILQSFPSAGSRIVMETLKGFQNFTMVLAAVITLALLDPQLTVLAIFLSFVATFLVTRLNAIIRLQAFDIRQKSLQMRRTSLSAVESLKLIHLNARGEETREAFGDQLVDLQRSQYRNAWVAGLVTPLYSITTMGLLGLVMVAATYLLSKSTEAWVILMAAFLMVTNRLIGKTGKYAKRKAALAKQMPSMEAILEFLNHPGRTRLKDGRWRFKGIKQGVRLDNVDFSYTDGGRKVLQNVDIEVPRGKMIALVGSSGAGKSTVVDMIARLYDPTKGRVLVDGVNLRRYKLTSWRRSMAVVSQETFLFDASVADNIRYSDPDASDERVIQAAKRAGAWDFIQRLEGGLDARLGDRGVRLSGGERQRVAIARAFLSDPELLILDEATSALDTKTEKEVHAAINELRKDRTVIAVAHRLSTIRSADQIIVLDAGRVVERGTHRQLMAHKNGAYAAFVSTQRLVEEAGSGADTAAKGSKRKSRLEKLVAKATMEVASVDLSFNRQEKEVRAALGALPGVVSAVPIVGGLRVVLRPDSGLLAEVVAATKQAGGLVESIAPSK